MRAQEPAGCSPRDTGGSPGKDLVFWRLLRLLLVPCRRPGEPLLGLYLSLPLGVYPGPSSENRNSKLRRVQT